MSHLTRQRSAIQIRVQGRVVGYVSGGVFSKAVRASRHFLRDPLAIGFAESSLADADAAGASVLEVLAVESGGLYCVNLAHFHWHAFPVQRAGLERQLALRLARWILKGGKQQQNSTRPAAAKPPESIAWRPEMSRKRPPAASVDGDPPQIRSEPAQLSLFETCGPGRDLGAVALVARLPSFK